MVDEEVALDRARRRDAWRRIAELAIVRIIVDAEIGGRFVLDVSTTSSNLSPRSKRYLIFL
jgi:hypothetical protein